MSKGNINQKKLCDMPQYTHIHTHTYTHTPDECGVQWWCKAVVPLLNEYSTMPTSKTPSMIKERIHQTPCLEINSQTNETKLRGQAGIVSNYNAPSKPLAMESSMARVTAYRHDQPATENNARPRSVYWQTDGHQHNAIDLPETAAMLFRTGSVSRAVICSYLVV